ncbi:MAG TPA: TA system VapC family ribonuclease toxin [Bryobacteraceae bacterium]|nr:TA system VapC family ribonuclease toxin [Bryobacteraceae bacterium]
MAVSLLDTDVLMALAWPNNLHHDAAHRWFAENQHRGWATCPHTQLGFLRLSMQPAVVKTAIGFGDALRALTASVSSSKHEFWPMTFSFIEIAEDIRSRIAGHHQLADAVLIDLAMRNSGKLATFDRRIVSLVKPGSASEAAVDLIAA